MYTRCPHCTTIFQVTAEQLRTAHGEISCVTCAQTFSALDSLTDDIATLISTLNEHAEPESPEPDSDVEEDTDIAPALTGEEADEPEDAHADEPEDAHADEPEDAHADEPEDAHADEPEDAHADEPVEVPGEEFGTAKSDVERVRPGTLEFDAPEQTWTNFFLQNGEQSDTPLPDSGLEFDDDTHGDPETESLDSQIGDPGEWHSLLADLDDDEIRTGEPSLREDRVESDDPDISDDDHWGDGPKEVSIIPPWLAGESEDDDPEQTRPHRLSWPTLGLLLTLILLLVGQLIHYNRDSLAADPTYGAFTRKAYALLDISLYPDWPLDVFEVTGTEAITGRSNPQALDILANVIVNGREPVGLPLIRVELKDRWSNPVASRVFAPADYLREFDEKTDVVDPGTALSVDISVVDPGAKALSYIVDVCLPRRKTGLECQIARNPFQ